MQYEKTYEYGIICTICDGQALPLGQVGKVSYYKCRDCGMDFGYEHTEYDEKI
jgi:hypothetical protein